MLEDLNSKVCVNGKVKTCMLLLCFSLIKGWAETLDGFHGWLRSTLSGMPTSSVRNCETAANIRLVTVTSSKKLDLTGPVVPCKPSRGLCSLIL